MRSCPSCQYPNNNLRVKDYNATSLINAKVEGSKLYLLACSRCNMLYVDGGFDVDQAWFDNYYLKFYKTDDKPFSGARLESLARCIKSYEDVNFVVDIGGKDGELQMRMEDLCLNVFTVGVGDNPGCVGDAVVLSHTFEHIYDIPAMMEKVQSFLLSGGLLFIEVPIWLDYTDLTYDNHWQHINKFRPSDLENILKTNGFDVVLSERIADYREYNVWRIIGRMG